MPLIYMEEKIMIKHAITLIGLCISTHAWALHTANITWDSLYRKQDRIYGMQFSIETETFSEPTSLTPEGKNCCSPSLSFNAKGEGIIAWHQILRHHEDCVQVADLIVD